MAEPVHPRDGARPLAADELLAGAAVTYEIEIPPGILDPSRNGHDRDGAELRTVRIRPLTVRDLQVASRAARDTDDLTAAVMIHQALVEPELTLTQVAAMHVGLVQFLLAETTRVSGISATTADLQAAADAPLSNAAFVLAREFGWTPQQVGELTLGQVLLHLQMLREQGRP